MEDLLAAIRRLPLDERLQLIERVADEAAEDTPKPPVARASTKPSLLGLIADDPDLIDRMCAIVYQARGSARMRRLEE